MTRTVVDTAGVALMVDVRGHGDPVLVLHGFAGDGSSMDPLTDLLTGRRIVPDLVGHGGSAAPADPTRYTMPAVVEQLAAVVGLLGIGQLDVVGYSMGARVALSLAHAEPAVVRTLTLIGGTAGIEDAREAALRVAADEELATRIEREGVDAFVDHWEALPLFASQRTLSAERQAAIRAGRRAQRAEGLAGHLRGAGTGAMPSLWRDLGVVAAPTLLITGSLDEKFTAIARRMADAMPDARAIVVPGVGHAAHLEDPDTVAEATEAHRRRA